MTDTRCLAIHDFTGWAILRCTLEMGHEGNHKPRAYEPCTEAEYQALKKRAEQAS